MMTRTPHTGDEVRTKRLLPITLSDTLFGSGLPERTGGVVLAGPRGFFKQEWQVRFDAPGGFVNAWVDADALTVVRRGVGTDRFERRAELTRAARWGIRVAFIAPLIWFVIRYVIANSGTDGLLLALADGALYGTLDLLTYVISQPVTAAVYIALSWFAWRFAVR